MSFRRHTIHVEDDILNLDGGGHGVIDQVRVLRFFFFP